MKNTTQTDEQTERGERFHKTVLKDLHAAHLEKTLRQDVTEIYQFYVDSEAQDRLATMGSVQRWFYAAAYFMRSLYFKLTAPRRILLLLALLLFFIGLNDQSGQLIISFLILLFILVLELKDKLLAQDELEAGRAVQTALMPDDQPKLPGWQVWLFSRTANEVGGDLVDYLYLPEDRLGLAIGDVAGKGLGAALYMAKLQATLRVLAVDYPELDRLGERLNETFCRDRLPNRFASLLFTSLSSDSNEIRLLNAGHFPPIVLRGRRLERLSKGSAALGLSSEATYHVQHTSLDDGDTLVAYSDGVTEARNEYGQFFEEERFERILRRMAHQSAERIGRAVIEEVDRFIGEARAHDDLSLVILQRKPLDNRMLPPARSE